MKNVVRKLAFRKVKLYLKRKLVYHLQKNAKQKINKVEIKERAVKNYGEIKCWKREQEEEEQGTKRNYCVKFLERERK